MKTIRTTRIHMRLTVAGDNRPTRTQSVQDRIISETHSSLLQRGGRGKGAAAPFPCTPNPRRAASASLRTTSPGPSRLTKPNTSCTIITPASLRSECCSPSLRNAVRLPSGIDVHLHRNTQVGKKDTSVIHDSNPRRDFQTVLRSEEHT